MTSFDTGFAGPGEGEGTRADVLLSPAQGIFALAASCGHLAAPRRAIALFRAELEHHRVARGTPGRVAGALARTNVSHFRAEGIGATERAPYGVSVVVVDGGSPGTVEVSHVGHARAYLFRGEDARLLTEPHVVRRGRKGASIVTRAIGLGTTVDVASTRIETMGGDVLVLATDDLATVVLRPHVLAQFEGGAPPWTLANAIARLGRGLGHDGTVVVLRVVS